MWAWTRKGAVEMVRALDSGYVLKGEPKGIVNRLDLCVGERAKYGPMACDLSYIDGVCHLLRIQ